MKKKVTRYALLVLLLAVGLTLRIVAFTPFLTYVDSYKYLLQAQSFTSPIAIEYVKEQSWIFAKWGFALVLSVFDALMHLNANDLMMLAKVVNIVLSLILALLIWQLNRRSWFISVPVFLSPLFFGYSSYVISEYLSLSLIAICVLILRRITVNSAYRKLGLIVTGLIIGFLPFIRIEMAVASVVFALHVIQAHRGRSLWVLVPALTFSSLIGLVIGSVVGGVTYFEVLKNLILTNPTYLMIVGLLMGGYVLTLRWGYKWLVCGLGVIVWVCMVVGLLESFALVNALFTDPALYVFGVMGLGYVLNRLLTSKIKLPYLLGELVMILAGLVGTYAIFDRNIDRYALTIFTLILMIMALFVEEKLAVWLKRLSVVTTILFCLVAVRHIVVYQPQESDYQQYVMQHLPVELGDKVYMSGYLYLASLYFKGEVPLIADELAYGDIRTGDVIVWDDSLSIANQHLYVDIQKNLSEFTQIAVIPTARIFGYNEGLIHTGNAIIALRKN